MRTVQAYSPGDLRRYVPDIDDNRRDPSPVTVWIRQPTERQKRALDEVGTKWVAVVDETGKVVVDERGNVHLRRDESIANKRAELACERCVEKVENYVGANGEPIETGAQLAEHGELLFVRDIGAEIETSFSLREDSGKGYVEPSDSESSETQASTGNAPSADETGLPSNATATGKATPNFDMSQRPEGSTSAQSPG